MSVTRSLSKIAQSDDLVVPVDQIANCIKRLTEEAKKYDFTMFCLAHAGDGNLHFQHMKGDMSDEAWEQQQHAFHETAYSYVYSLGHKKSPGSAGYPESGQSDECILISVAIIIIAGTDNCKTVLSLLKQRSSE